VKADSALRLEKGEGRNGITRGTTLHFFRLALGTRAHPIPSRLNPAPQTTKYTNHTKEATHRQMVLRPMNRPSVAASRESAANLFRNRMRRSHETPLQRGSRARGARVARSGSLASAWAGQGRLCIRLCAGDERIFRFRERNVRPGCL